LPDLFTLPINMANGDLRSPEASSVRFPDLLPLCRLLCAYICTFQHQIASWSHL